MAKDKIVIKGARVHNLKKDAWVGVRHGKTG